MYRSMTWMWVGFAALLVWNAPSATAGPPDWKVGLASVKITPTEPVRMSGYASRTQPSQGVALDLYAKALALEDRDVHAPDLWRDKILCSQPERAAVRRIMDLGMADLFRRFHEQSSSWDRTNRDHQLAYYDPSRQIGIELHRWRRHLRQVAAVSRAPLSLNEKARLYAHLARRAWWDREPLGRELLARWQARAVRS